jgi:pyruvate dehydrogenase E1 component alpha subunit
MISITELKQFEQDIAELFRAKKIHCPIHLSGGNEKELIKIFKQIKPDDYVFSTHRNHFHYLLHTGNKAGLISKILAGDSMHTCDPEHNFYSSSIVAGCVAIACGVALALKMKKSKQRVFCFVGDGVTDEGWFGEAFKYALLQDLPITYIVEDNDRSVIATLKQRWGSKAGKNKSIWYKYKCEWPHAGCGEWVTF